jgi:nitroreductase
VIESGGGGTTLYSEGWRKAPLIVVALSDKDVYLDRYAQPDKGWTDRSEARWPVPYWDIDAGFGALLMHLTAIDAGLATCFAGIMVERIPHFRREFGVPDRFNPVGYVTAGHAAPDRRSPSLKRGHRPVQDVIHRGRW